MKIKKYVPGLTSHVGPEPSVGPAMSELGNAAKAFYRAGHEIGQAAEGLGKTIEGIAQKKRDEKRKQDLNESLISSQEEWGKLKHEIETSNPTSEEYVDSMKQGWDAIMEKHYEKIADLEVKRAFREKNQTRWFNEVQGIQKDATQQWYREKTEIATSQIKRAERLAIEADTQENHKLFQEQIDNQIRDAEFYLGAATGEKLRRESAERIKKERQSFLVDKFTTAYLKDPEKAMADMIGGKYDEIEEQYRHKMFEKAREHKMALLRDQKIIDDQILKEAKTKEEDELDILLITGKLTQEDILNSKYADKYTYERRRLERLVQGSAVKSDFKTLAFLRERVEYIDNPEDQKKFKGALVDASNKGLLSTQDAEQLLEKAMSRLGGVEGEYIKRVHKEFRAELAPTSDILGLPRVAEDEEAVSRAQILLDQAIIEARKRGKPLSGVEIYQKGREILRIPGLKVIGKRTIIKEKAKEERERMKEKRMNMPPRNERESVDDYLKRIGVPPVEQK